MNLPNVLFVNQVFTHHSNVSGYQQVALCYPHNKRLFQLITPANKREGTIGAYLSLISARINNQLRLYEYVNRSSKIDLIHVLYGDMDLPLPFINYRNIPIVATFHQPTSYLTRSDSRVKHLKKQLSSLSAVITLCHAQENLFSEMVGAPQFFTIPHGVNREFFKPADVKRDRSILVVGNWLRDWDFTLRVVEIILSAHPGVSVKVVSPSSDNPLTKEIYDNLIITGRLSDEELRLEYQRCGVIFFSFLDATANNAILEAAACGCRIVASDIGGVRDYVGDAACLFKPGTSSDDVANILLSELTASSEQRHYQNLLSWESVIAQLSDLYAQLIGYQ
jgi:glycosyltransferase involved in cell wall biosynthesis